MESHPVAIPVYLLLPIDFAADVLDGLVDDPALHPCLLQVSPHVRVGRELLLGDAVMCDPHPGGSACDRLDVVTPRRHDHPLTPRPFLLGRGLHFN